MHRTSWITICVLLSAGGSLLADEKSAADLLPEKTVVYAEIPAAATLVSTLLDHPVTRHLQELPEYEAATSSPQFLQFRAGIAALEAQLGARWRPLLESLVNRGIYAGLDAETQGLVVLLRTRQAGRQTRLLEQLVELARADAANKNRPDPVREGEHRGIKAYQLNDLRVAAFGDWLMLTNKSELGKSVLDRHLDGSESCLTASEPFQRARDTPRPESTGWAYIDLDTLRNAGAAKGLFAGKADNPLAELLVGGILSTLQQTPYATAAMTVNNEALDLKLALPHQAAWTGAAREYYFGPGGAGRAPTLIEMPNVLFAASTYRDIAGMWRHAGELFDERVNDGIAKAESNLSTLFAGKDFGEEILARLQPGIQLVAVRQDLTGQIPRPAIKLPAFAVLFRLREPEATSADFRRTFQSLIGFLNVIGAMNDQPQLDMESERIGEARLIVTRYIPDADDEQAAEGRINYNFSPTVAFQGERFILASTANLARELVRGGNPSDASTDNTVAQVTFEHVRRVLQDNREQLIAQNMLQKGHGRDAAEKEIGALMMVLGFIDNVRLRLATENEQLGLNLRFELASKPDQ